MKITAPARILLVISLSLQTGSCSYYQEDQYPVVVDQTLFPNGRYDQWEYMGPGGGGAMFNPTVNPSDPDNIFVSCDMTGSFVTYDGGEHWRMFNLRGVTEFYSFDRNDPDVVYAGTSNMLFKSNDQGVSWQTIYPRPEDIVAIFPKGDHATEVMVTTDSIITSIKKLVVDPVESKRIYLLVRKQESAYRSPSNKSVPRFFMEILFSDDAGDHWKSLDKLRFDLDNIFVDPTSPIEERTIYVSGKDGIGAKKNGAWGKIPQPAGMGPITQVVDAVNTATNQHIIYTISGRSYFNREGNKGDSRIYMTSDEGTNWTRIDSSFLAYKLDGADDPELRAISTSYYHPESIYISYANLQLRPDSTSMGVAVSNDYGKTWMLSWKDEQTRGLSSPNRESGWIDERFGPGWGENPFHLGVAAHNPEICYTTDFGRTIKTEDGGKTWQQVYTNKLNTGGWMSRGLQVTTGYLLAFDPYDSQHMLLADTDTGLMESYDGGRSWLSATDGNGVPQNWVNTTYWVTFDPEIKEKVWAVMSNTHDLPRPKMWRHSNMSDYEGGVVVSINGGRTWKPISGDIGEAAITHIIMDPKSDAASRTLYVCAFGKGVYKSENGGISWFLKTSGIEGDEPAAWRIYRKLDGTLFLIVSRKNDSDNTSNALGGALYRSTDGAETWEKMDLPKGVNGPTSLLIDPRHSNRLFLSAWGRSGKTEFTPDRGGGIYVSNDEGLNWETLFTEDQHIHDLTMDARSGTIYACGFNSSAYRSDNEGQSWKRIKGYNFKWGKRVQPDPRDPDQVYIITFGGGVWHGPAHGDPKALEDIVTSKTAYK